MRVEVFKFDLIALIRQIEIYKFEKRGELNYLVMSQETLERIKCSTGYNLVFNQEHFSGELCGVKIAVNSSLKLGQVDIV